MSLSFIQGFNSNEIYGNYTMVMVYPNSMMMPMCLTIGLSPDGSNAQCTCSDGNNSTRLMVLTYIERIAPHRVIKQPEASTEPMRVIDDGTDLLDLRNVTCNCAEKEYHIRLAFKNINDNYMLAYVVNDLNSFAKRDFLCARNLPSSAELEADITRIEELNQRNGTRMCTREIYEEIRPKH